MSTRQDGYETAFFINSAPNDADETEYLAEEYLTFAKKQLFIVGAENYHFTNERIKSYFKAQLSKREKYHHRKFSGYLQKRHADDYYNRGKHLRLSLQTNDSKFILEAWQLLFLSYLRRASKIGEMDDIYNILDQINHPFSPHISGHFATNLRYVECENQVFFDYATLLLFVE